MMIDGKINPEYGKLADSKLEQRVMEQNALGNEIC